MSLNHTMFSRNHFERPRHLLTSIEEVRNRIPQWLNRDFAFDVETSGLRWQDHRLLGLALAFDDASYYISLAHTTSLWEGHELTTFIDEKVFADTLTWLFSQPNPVMIGHNVKFDMHFLRKAGIHVKGRVADTLLAAQLLDENRENDLKALSTEFLNFDYSTYAQLAHYAGYSKKEILGVHLDDAADYAMNDVDATLALYPILMNQLHETTFRDRSLHDVYAQTWMPLLIVLYEMEARGIALDLDTVRTIREEYLEIATKHQNAFLGAAGRLIIDRYGKDIPPMYLKTATEDDLEAAYEADDGRRYVTKNGVELPIITHDMVGRNKTWRPRIITVNPGSSKQLQDIVYNLSGVELPDEIELKTTPKGEGLSTDKDNLQTLVFFNAERTPQLIHDLLVWRKADKFIGTYLDRFLTDANPNDHDSINTWFALAGDDENDGGTRTGRLSSRSPNLTNIPSRGDVGKKARAMFVSRPNHVLLVGDYGQAELRMLAHYSHDPELIKAFEEGRDLHILTGAGFARMEYEELKERYDAGDDEAKQLRALGKTGNFALNYGMGPVKFRRFLIVNNNYHVSQDQAKDWIEGYNEKYQIATNWKRNVIKFVRQNAYVVTFGGRFRHLPDVRSRNRKVSSYAERQGVNAIIQGSVADIICAAMIPIQKALRGLGGSLLLQVHDELVAEVPEENALLGKAIMEDLMIRTCNPYLLVPQVAEVHIGKDWASAKG